MMQTRIEVKYLHAPNGETMAEKIRVETRREGFIAIDPFSPWFAQNSNSAGVNVILVLTFEDVSDERPQRYR